MSETGPVERPDDAGKRKLSARQIAALVLGVVIVVFAIANTQKATIDFVVGDISMPLFVVIAVVGLIGFGAGWLVRGRHDKPG